MRSLIAALLGLTFASLLASELRAATIHIAGDSTAAPYPADRYPQAGWGEFLGCGLDGGVAVRNHAVGGRSTRTFIGEGRLDRLVAELRPGDTVLIQFGHNDAFVLRPQRFVAADSDYRLNLWRIIRAVRMGGGQPVLLTPVIRRNFAEGRIVADFADYTRVVREVAQATGTPLIDLQGASGAWVQKAGVEGSRRLFLHLAPGESPAHPNGVTDDTHFNELGARGIADIVARELKALALPVSAHVLADRPDLARTTPLGRTACR